MCVCICMCVCVCACVCVCELTLHNVTFSDTEPVALPEVADPIIVWWTPLTGEKGATKLCGQKQCFFTVNRAYRHHPNTRVLSSRF